MSPPPQLPHRVRAPRATHGRRPTVLVLEGGGALGAWHGGAWSVLAPWLRERDALPVAIAGSSIGAVTGALVARHLHADDAGAGALRALWFDEIATRSAPLAAPLAPLLAEPRDAGRLDGLLTALLLGNRALHRAEPAHWAPLAGLARSDRPLADRRRMAGLLERCIGTLPRGAAPWFAAAAVDVMRGRLALFDSGRGDVTPAQLMASTAIPLVYEPVELDGTLYWDGDMTHESLLGPLLARLAEGGVLRPGERPWLLTLSLRPRVASQRPRSSLQLSWRMLELLLSGKLDADEAARHGHADALAIARGSLPGDDLSREFDYSPGRLEELFAQGAADAAGALRERTVPA